MPDRFDSLIKDLINDLERKFKDIYRRIAQLEMADGHDVISSVSYSGSHDDLSDVSPDDHHDPVTLDSVEIQNVLDLSTQALDLDTQTSRYAFLAPDGGGKPAFRAITEADISDLQSYLTEVALSDIQDYTRGSIIRGGAAAWEALTIGAANTVLKSDGTDVAWDNVDHSELTGVGADDHHTRYTDAEAEAVADTQIATHAADASAHGTAVDDLSDVDAAAPNDEDVLTWDTGDSKWVAAAASGGGEGNRQLLFSQVVDVTVDDTTTETTILGSGRGSKTITADELAQGSVIVVVLQGYLSTTSTPNLTIAASLGGSEVCTTGAQTLADTIADEGFTVRIEITCRSTGATGSVVAGGTLEYSSGNQHKLIKTSVTTVDTTAALAVDVTVKWGTADAANTITAQIATIELVKADDLDV
jgi:hypothetical protein